MRQLPALLVLENGAVFRGLGFGAKGSTVGEVVFNTAMSGYQEILTDPSYCRQIVALTAPHVGNVGLNRADAESATVQVAGLVIRDLPRVSNNWRAEESLAGYLKRHQRIGIADIDTRRLTRMLRNEGALAGCIIHDEAPSVDAALAQARAFGGLKGMDLAQLVSVTEPYDFSEGSYDLDLQRFADGEREFHVVAYDFGVKRNILRLLADFGCRVTVVPAQTPAAVVRELKPDGVFLSNGPGDPEPCTYAIAAACEFIAGGTPVFGICLGHQILGLALGARTIKMKFGHHGANHPVIDLATGRVMISSQNHGFAVDEATLPSDVVATHRSLFDGSLQGLKHQSLPVSGFQGHPEASPGPHDVKPLFAPFIAQMRERKAA